MRDARQSWSNQARTEWRDPNRCGNDFEIVFPGRSGQLIVWGQSSPRVGGNRGGLIEALSGKLAVLGAAFGGICGADGDLCQVGIENINSDFATFIRTIVILMALGGILAATGQFQPLNTISSKTYLFLILSGLATGASWIAYFRALKIGQAAQVAPVDKLSVVLVAIFGVIFLGEKLTGPNWLGIGLIMAGAVLVAWR